MDSPVSTFPKNSRHTPPHSGLYVCTGDLTSGFHGYTVSKLATEALAAGPTPTLELSDHRDVLVEGEVAGTCHIPDSPPLPACVHGFGPVS